MGRKQGKGEDVVVYSKGQLESGWVGKRLLCSVFFYQSPHGSFTPRASPNIPNSFSSANRRTESAPCLPRRHA